MSDMLSQEEIDALLGGGSSEPDSQSDISLNDELLTDIEKDALGEVGNISMGTAATTLFTLLGKKVDITTPRVSETTFDEIAGDILEPCVVIKIVYEVGIEGVNLLVLHENDVKIITDLMMGGEGKELPDELNDLHLSAISEAMNQMIGSSSTSLSEMLKQKIDISPPEAIYENISQIDPSKFGMERDDKLVKIAFQMTIGDLIDSEIMQILPYSVAKQMFSTLTAPEEEVVVESEPIAKNENVNKNNNVASPQENQQANTIKRQQPAQNVVGSGVSSQGNINASALEFENFNAENLEMYYNNEIELIKDVPLEISVELGRTTKKINEILDFGSGTIIELDKLIGDSLDVLANGKKIAKGEVVVVDENYGIRITEILVSQKKT